MSQVGCTDATVPSEPPDRGVPARVCVCVPVLGGGPRRNREIKTARDEKGGKFRVRGESICAPAE